MKILFYLNILLLLVITSCSTATNALGKREYRRAKTLLTYKSMENELEDGHLILKEHNYFKFYQTAGLLVTIRQDVYTGWYSWSGDTLRLNWQDADPKKIKPFLSRKCVADSLKQNIWFIDEVTNQRRWELRLFPNR